MVVKIELPAEWKNFEMPIPLQRRLQRLLDQQDREGKLSKEERSEAEALANLSEMLSYLKLQAKPKNGRSGR